ncbi:50S ribosomal protein L15 [Spiroplasma syrphidicola EA-1]|uniref:Large ribosomal subunit protein uL15 n=1 Tax=Spiroplasma syrphidicola EA-1 TaxID=1276229 RepID=R4UD40_9MOLU|nr:50S ribosomal protein L15 [Spiroplasma syrphidicola]AGM25829.1 50S ribosomal protein L15 [Spiroplasma syrphidicola EA-1]
MKLNELQYTEGSRHSKKRLGRGTGSGIGKTSGKGHKGQNARSGGGVRPGFEGGQTPIFRRLPKVGFTSLNKKDYTILNLNDLETINLTDVNHKTLVEKKVIKNEKALIKILGNGKITKTVNVKVNKISASAKDAIEKAGGKVEVV